MKQQRRITWQELQKIEALNAPRLGKPWRPIFAVSVSEDHGQTWRTKALCDECYAAIEPPTRAKKNGVAGGNCEVCAARNERYKR